MAMTSNSISPIQMTFLGVFLASLLLYPPSYARNNQVVKIGNHCSIVIPPGYRKTFNNSKETSFVRDQESSLSRIVLKNGNYSSLFHSISLGEQKGWIDYGDNGKILYARYIRKRHKIDVFRILFKDYSISISGGDAKLYRTIAEKCLPPEFRSIDIPEDITAP
jgi:hypothetical protein